jgi:hypothetical protein
MSIIVHETVPIGMEHLYHEMLSRDEVESLLRQAEARARAEGEKIGELKQRIREREFTASSPNEHHAIRSNAAATIVLLRAELEKLLTDAAEARKEKP